MREIVLDTETTGFDPFSGDKIVEIGCVELDNHLPTGRTYQRYLNPMRQMTEDVIKVHGLTQEFLADKPVFKEIAQEFLDFIGDDSVLIIHNAPFDMKFLNCELEQAELPQIPMTRVIDTLLMARSKFPGAQANLNALCKRFNIDLSIREKHGALLDSELLAEVYLELIGGKQPLFGLKKNDKEIKKDIIYQTIKFDYRCFDMSTEDIENHKKFISELPNNLWND